MATYGVYEADMAMMLIDLVICLDDREFQRF